MITENVNLYFLRLQKTFLNDNRECKSVFFVIHTTFTTCILLLITIVLMHFSVRALYSKWLSFLDESSKHEIGIFLARYITRQILQVLL